MAATTWTYRHVPEMLTAYRKAFAHLKSREDATIRIHWHDDPVNLDGFRREFVQAMNRRINLKVQQSGPSRKLCSNYQLGLRRDQFRLRDIHARVRVYQFETKEVAARFGDRLSRYDD